MIRWFPISLVAALGLSGPAFSGSGGGKPAILDVMLIYIDGTRKFTVFVEPNTIDRKTALKAATQKAGKFCRDTFDSRKIRYTKIKRRTWGVPDAWNIYGICE